MQHRPLKGQFQFLCGTDERFFDFFSYLYFFIYLESGAIGYQKSSQACLTPLSSKIELAQ